MRKGDTWPSIWLPWVPYPNGGGGKAGITLPRLAWLLHAGPMAAMLIPWVGLWIALVGLRDRRCPVSLDLFVSGAALALLSWWGATVLESIILARAAVYCVIPMVLGGGAATVECAIQRSPAKWWLAALVAQGCALAYYTLLIAMSGVFQL